MIHKKILQAGANNPDASLEELADEVSGASPQLVERVFDEYGDPASGTEREADAASGGADSNPDDSPVAGSEVEAQPDEDESASGQENAADGDGSVSQDEVVARAESAASKGSGSATVPTTSTDDRSGAESEATATDAASGSTASQDAGAQFVTGTGSSKSSGSSGQGGSDAAGADVAAVDRTGTTSNGSTAGPASRAPEVGGESRQEAGPAAPVDPSELTDRQRETLRAIAAHPDATQAELAEELDVSAATISNRVASIPGIEWESRREFVDAMFDDGASSTDDAESTDHASPTGALAEQVDALERQVAELDRRVDEAGGSGALSDPELAHKVVHACMSSERISEDEELRILEAMLD